MAGFTRESRSRCSGLRFGWASSRVALAVVAGLAMAVAPLGASEAGAALISTTETVLGAPGFGRAVSTYGANEIVASGPDAALVYARGVGGWALETTLRPSDGVPGDGFGTALLIEGTYVVIGAPNATVDGTPGAGAAYVFAQLADGTWFQYPRLVAPTPLAGAHFGAAVAMAAEVQVVVGEPGAGTATIFTRNAFPGDWALAAQLGAPGLTPDEAVAAGFGTSVAISEGVVTVGAPDAPVAVTPPTLVAHAGTVFAFRQVGSTFPLDATLVDSPSVTDGHFGQTLAMQAGTTIVGAPGSQSLAAFQFQGPGIYTPIGRDLGGVGFGTAIGAGGSYGAAGDPTARAVYVYGRDTVAGGVLVGTLTPSGGPNTDGFGASVAIGENPDTSATIAVVGAPGTHTIHIFDLAPIPTPDHLSISLPGPLSYTAAGDVLGNFTVTRSGGHVTAITGAGRLNVGANHAPFIGMDLHALAQSRLLIGQIRIRDYATGFVHTFQTIGITNATGATHINGTAIGFDLTARPLRPALIHWTIDNLAT
jgi:hypothetical protein